MGLLAGFETLLGLAMFNSYGWRNSSALKGWGAFGAVVLGVSLVMPKLFYRFNYAKIVAVCFVGSFGALLDVNFLDTSEPVPKWQFFTAFGSVGLGLILYTIVMSIVSVKIPKEAQVSSHSFVQFMGQLGRGLGPVVATKWYDYLTKAFGVKAGLSAAGSFMVTWILLGMLVPIRHYTTFFGHFSDLSRYEADKLQKQTDKKSTML